MGKPRFELENIWRYDQYDYAMMDICTFFQCVSCRKKIPCPGTENCTRINISSRYGRLITILVGNGMGMVLPILPYFPSLKVQLSVAYIVTECLRSKKESYKTVQCQWAETWNRLELVQAIFQAHQTTGEAEFILVDMFTSRVFTYAGLDNCRLESFAPLLLEYVAPSAISIGVGTTVTTFSGDEIKKCHRVAVPLVSQEMHNSAFFHGSPLHSAVSSRRKCRSCFFLRFLHKWILALAEHLKSPRVTSCLL
jgi:hypothetical protein